MNEKSDKRGLAAIAALVIFCFYVAIMLYVFFAILDISVHNNFVCALLFECIGFFMLLAIILCSTVGKAIQLGYMVPIVLCTILYTIILDAVNIAGFAVISSSVFFLVHMVLLFIYLLIVLPMLVIGKR